MAREGYTQRAWWITKGKDSFASTKGGMRRNVVGGKNIEAVVL
jgi:hypothetical protein